MNARNPPASTSPDTPAELRPRRTAGRPGGRTGWNPAAVVGRRLPVVLRLDVAQPRRVGLLGQRPLAAGGVAGVVGPRPRLVRRHGPEPMSV